MVIYYSAVILNFDGFFIIISEFSFTKSRLLKFDPFGAAYFVANLMAGIYFWQTLKKKKERGLQINF